jgi:hypothetical protein
VRGERNLLFPRDDEEISQTHIILYAAVAMWEMEIILMRTLEDSRASKREKDAFVLARNTHCILLGVALFHPPLTSELRVVKKTTTSI